MIRSNKSLMRLIKEFFDLDLGGKVPWGTVRIERYEAERIDVAFGRHVISIESSEQKPPLGQIELSGAEHFIGPVDAASWRSIAGLIAQDQRISQ